ncbi:MAG: dTDP-4-dehydrorhamnose reductase [Chloroflexi bacterium]|nr:dTDP-4-dehydrorhamnose reductase [Chloroflexota bacterium]
MRIAITGSRGQLGQELKEVLSERHQVIALDKPEYDITKREVSQAIADSEPEVVIHCAAMTHVDGCALDPQRALEVNALGTRNVALGCLRARAELVYISTNEVFDGAKDSPYWEFDTPHPVNPYGASKLAGEDYVRQLLHRFYVVRTSWLFGRGGRNFVLKILEKAQGESRLPMVMDEVASPTYAPDLAQAIGQLLDLRVYGTYHLTNSGGCSRFEYAQTILKLAGREHVELVPISAAEYVRPSRPPLQSRLHNYCGAQLGIALRPWQEALRHFIAEQVLYQKG